MLFLPLFPAFFVVVFVASSTLVANALLAPILLAIPLCCAGALANVLRCGIVCRCERIHARHIHVRRSSGEDKALKVDIVGAGDFVSPGDSRKPVEIRSAC